MNDFDFDCLQKKRIAKSSKNHINARRGKCKLPHEYLTRKELDALNGEVKTYNLGSPMDRKTFLLLPYDLQREYLLRLQKEFRANDGMISSMMGCSDATIRLDRIRLNVPSLGRGGQTKREPGAMKKWETWLGEDTEEMPDKEKPVLASVPDRPAAMQGWRASWASVHSWEELYTLAKQFPFPERPAFVTLEVYE